MNRSKDGCISYPILCHKLARKISYKAVYVDLLPTLNV